MMDKDTARKHLQKIYDATTAEATQKAIAGSFWKYDIKDADNFFKKVLPLEKQAEAVRRFFYETDNKNFTKTELSKKVSDIAQDMLRITKEDILKDNDLKIEGKPKISVFASEAEVEKANLPDGTRVIVNGKEYIWRK